MSLPAYPFERRRHWKSQQAVLVSARPECASADDSSVFEPTLRDEAATFRAELHGRQGDARMALLRSVIRAELARLVRTDEARIEPNAPLQDLGIDSLMGLQLRSRLETRTGIVLSSTRMWEKPTPEAWPNSWRATRKSTWRVQLRRPRKVRAGPPSARSLEATQRMSLYASRAEG